MNWAGLPYLVPHVFSLAISCAIAVYCWHRRREAGTLAYAVVAINQALWTLGYAFEVLSASLEGKLFWDDFQFIGWLGWVGALLVFSFEYAGRPIRRQRLVYMLLAVPVVVGTALAYTNPAHELVRTNIRLVDGLANEPALLYDFPPSYWMFSLYTYAVYLMSVGVLALALLRTHRLYRTQVALVMTGTLVPMVGTFLTNTVLENFPYRDLSPFTFTIGNLLIGWGLLRFRLFDVVPVARDLVVESVADAVFVLDQRDRVVDVNAAGRAMLGATALPVVGRPVTEAFAQWPTVLDHITSRAHIGDETRSAEVVVSDGAQPRYLDVREHLVRGRSARSRGRVVVARDITARRQAEEQLAQYRERLEELVRERTIELRTANEHLLDEMTERARLEERYRQAQKMEAIGRLAGGVAHDFNNMLTAISGFADLLLRDEELSADARSDVTQILRAARQAAALTHQLLAFSRRQVLTPVTLSLNRIVDEMQPMLRRLIDEDIEVVTNLAPDAGHVIADPGQLQQVLMNLVVNARDAMPRGGRLVITTHTSYREASDGAESEIPPGLYAVLSVSDTGEGMSAHTREHLFEPFFTTKPLGKGTGLGLATVHGIVKQSGGHIEVTSEPNQGSTLRVYLPHADEPVDEVSADHVVIPPRGTETILLVEDDDAVRAYVERVLVRHGYTVRSASNGSAALREVDHVQRLDLLVTDVVMPGGMSGLELAQRVQEIRPVLRVLFISGYSNAVVAKHGSGDVPIDLLQKPFRPAELLHRVRATLATTA